MRLNIYIYHTMSVVVKKESIKEKNIYMGYIENAYLISLI